MLNKESLLIDEVGLTFSPSGIDRFEFLYFPEIILIIVHISEKNDF